MLLIEYQAEESLYLLRKTFEYGLGVFPGGSSPYNELKPTIFKMFQELSHLGPKIHVDLESIEGELGINLG